MKKIFYLLALVLTFAACQKDSFRKVYPEETPSLEANLAQTEVTYGSDQLDLTVAIAAKETPLSTLTIKVVAGPVVLASEVVRTKDLHYDGEFHYAVPFKSGMQEGDDVRVLLSAENVEGVKAQLALTCIGHAPKLETMYAMPPQPETSLIGKGKQMTLKDGEFVIEGMAWPKKFDFFFAVEGTKFGRINWDKPVFGMLDGELTLVTKEQYESGAAAPISIVDEKHSSVDTIRFNPATVVWSYSGPEVKPVSALDVNVDLEAEPASISNASARKLYRGAKLLLEQDSEIEITGIADMENGLSYDYFEYLGGNKAKFLGKTDMYMLYYRVDDDYLAIEPDNALTYPDVMWMCGVGMSQPTKNAVAEGRKTSGWGFDSPDQNFACRTVADGVYQVTVYMNNTDAADEAHPGFGTVNFKFFHQHGWGGEEAGNNYEMSGDVNIVGSEEESNVGNWWAYGSDFAGIYRVTLDTKNHTCTYAKVK